MAATETDTRDTARTGAESRTRHGARDTREWRITPAAAIAVGLGAQLVGVGWEALWHTGLAARADALGLPSNLGFLGDHVVSNLGVLGVLGGAGWLLARGQGRRRGVVLVAAGGAVMQTVGAAWDLAGHVQGSENNPVAYSLIGLGFVLAVTALVLARRESATTL